MIEVNINKFGVARYIDIEAKRPCIRLGDKLLIFSCTEENIQYIIDNHLTKGSFNVITIQQLERYGDINDFKKGLIKLFTYIQFNDQSFILSPSSANVSVVCRDDKYYDAAHDVIDIVSIKITKIQYSLFPTMKELFKTSSFVGTGVYSIPDKSYTYSYEVTEHDATTIVITELDEVPEGLPEYNVDDSPIKYKLKETYINHYTTFSFEQSKSIFFSGLSMTTRNPDNTAVIRVFKLIKSEVITDEP